MCKDCFNDLHFIKDGCIKCGKPVINRTLEEQHIEGCNYCLKKRFYFDKAISCIEYNEVSKKIILGLKYNNKTYMSKYIAQIMNEKLSIESISFDYILFVPLHKRRLRKRGFNQAKKIANYLSILTNTDTMDCLIRKKNTKMLYSLKKEERSRELKEVFITNNNISKLKSKNVLIVDDIFTTGATTNEISKLLKLSGVENIFILTLLTKNAEGNNAP